MTKIRMGLLLFLLLLTGMQNLAEAEPVTLKVEEEDIRQVLFSLAQLSGQNMILDDSVQGKITAGLQDVEAEEAIALLCQMKGLSCEKSGDSLLIASKQAALQHFGELFVFPVRFAEAETVRQVVNLSLGKAGFPEEKTNTKESTKERDNAAKDGRSMSQNTAFFFDKETNQIVFYGTRAQAALVKKAIETVDLPGKQVLLEAKVIAIEKDEAKKLGAEWEWSKIPQYPAYTTEYRSTRNRSTENKDGTRSTIAEEVPETHVQRSVTGGTVPGILQFGKGPEGHPFEFYYAATLNALISSGHAKILSRPKIMTIQGREAVINIGGEVPVPVTATTNATTTTSYEYRDAGIILKYTPRVNTDGYITAVVHTEVSSPLYVEAMKAYRFQKRCADTTVRLKNGETIIIGGLIGSEEAKSMSRIPFLSELPVLGKFFRAESTQRTESEVMIFLTARIVDEQGGRVRNGN